MSKDAKIDLVKAFMQLEGNINIGSTCYNYDRNGGIEFAGYIKIEGEAKSRKIVMDKQQVEEINNCNTVMEIYNCYKEMGYF